MVLGFKKDLLFGNKDFIKETTAKRLSFLYVMYSRDGLNLYGDSPEQALSTYLLLAKDLGFCRDL